MKPLIDLHMHSLYSDDGEFTPTQLVHACYKQGITIMSIADHNSVKANTEGKAVAESLGIHYITGIEIDCSYKGINLHVLGYGIDVTQPIFSELEDNIMCQELTCSAKKIELTNALGFQITKEAMDSVSDNGVYTGEMFGEVLLADERYLDHEILKPYRQGGARSDNPFVNFYWDYYSQGKPCYTEIHYPSLAETIALIKQHGGVSVLAHPGNNLKGNFAIFDEMVDLGLQGVEVFSNYHDASTVTYFLNAARQHNILITCGSDYHGKTKPSITLGETHCTIDQNEIEILLRTYDLLSSIK